MNGELKGAVDVMEERLTEVKVMKQMELTEMTGKLGKFSHRGQSHQADGAHRNDRQARLVLTQRSRSSSRWSSQK